MACAVEILRQCTDVGIEAHALGELLCGAKQYAAQSPRRIRGCEIEDMGCFAAEGPTARRPAADRARRVRFCTQPGHGLCCCGAAAAALWSAPISASARFTLAVGSSTPAKVITG